MYGNPQLLFVKGVIENGNNSRKPNQPARLKPENPKPARSATPTRKEETGWFGTALR
jgi:hypothetical protein